MFCLGVFLREFLHTKCVVTGFEDLEMHPNAPLMHIINWFTTKSLLKTMISLLWTFEIHKLRENSDRNVKPPVHFISKSMWIEFKWNSLEAQKYVNFAVHYLKKYRIKDVGFLENPACQNELCSISEKYKFQNFAPMI